IAALKTKDDCKKFFEDLCTVSELKAMSQRLEVAKMLNDNVVYHEISKKTGASTATISRVNKCLYYGNGGYKKVICNLED
ncbi:MAG: TrpR-like protein, YerC/YecD, partial [Oscillospiraceae bacterium]|nr:TrpR-like protein, YerC/YecD [Oscillospiraceae bacterium]